MTNISVLSNTFAFVIIGPLFLTPMYPYEKSVDIEKLTSSQIKSLISLSKNKSILLSEDDFLKLKLRDEQGNSSSTSTLPGEVNWGDIQGNLTSQGDLQTVLSGKIDKEAGKGLSSENFTLEYKLKLDTLNQEISKAMAALVNGAPSIFDTLKEISDWIETAGNETSSVLQALSSKADKQQIETLQNQINSIQIPNISNLSTKTEVQELFESIDLTRYPTKTELNDRLSEVVTGEQDLSKYVTKDELTTDHYTKQETNSFLVSSSIASFDATGQKMQPLKIFSTTVMANSDGVWSVDYSHVGFTTKPVVTATGQATGTDLANRRFASLSPGEPSLTGCVGLLLSSSSVGLLAAMTMVAAEGEVNVIAMGY